MEDGRGVGRTRSDGVGDADAGPLLTLEEVAAVLKVPRSWIYERTRRKLIPHVKLGKYLRFPRAALSAWIHGAGGGLEPTGGKPDAGQPAQAAREGRGRPLRSRPPIRGLRA